MNFKSLITATAAVLTLVPAGAQGPQQLKARANAPVPPEPSTVICGIMVSNDDWKGDLSQAGVYTLEVKPDGKLTCLHRSQDMAYTAAGLMLNNVMYTISVSSDMRFYFNKYSSNTWNRTSHEEIDEVNVPSDLTYDPVTKRVYGGFWLPDDDYYGNLCSFSLSTAEATPLTGYWDVRDYHVMAAAPDGSVYTLYKYNGTLAKIDVTNRTPSKPIVQEIGRTGLEPEEDLFQVRVSSMTYDEANARLIAVVSQSTGYGANKQWFTSLVTIDPATGACTEVRRMPGNACMAAIYVMDTVTDPLAPALATAPTLVPSPVDPLQGTLSFGIPTLTFGGAPLTAPVMAIVDINGQSSVYGYYEAGQRVSLPVALQQGDNVVRLTLATDELRGESTQLTVYAGEDAPKAVSDVRLSIDGGVASVTWTAPAGGANGGALIPANLRYKVVRMPGNVTVAEACAETSLTDSGIDPAAKSVWYAVTAFNSVGEAGAVESNRVPGAGACDVPFDEPFDSADDFRLWTVVDLNGGPSWSFESGHAAYRNPMGEIAGDDWLFSPALNLEAGHRYKLSYSMRVNDRKYAENLQVKAGRSLSPEAMTMAIAEHVDYTNPAFTTFEYAFTADESGRWYIGLHYTGASKSYGVQIDDVTVAEFDGRIPAEVSNLTLTPGAEGALEATVAFEAPSTDVNGNELTSLSRVEITRADLPEDAPIAIMTDVAPGMHCSFTDYPTEAAVYTYSVRAFNLDEGSLAVTATAFVGEDVPAAPENLAIREVGSHPVVSWTAPSTGDHGGWYDPAKLTYTVYRGAYVGDKIGEGITACEFTDAGFSIPTARQDAVSYTVLSVYDGRTTRGTIADAVPVGKPYAVPATETFAAADMVYYPWIAQSSNAVRNSWTLETAGVQPVVADYSGDRGLACFHAVGEPEGVVSHFYSPKFDVAGVANPVVSFAMYHTGSMPGNGSMAVAVSVDGGEFVAVGESVGRADGEGWLRHTVALPCPVDAEYVRIRFTGTGDGVANIFIDDIRLDSRSPRNLMIASLVAPVTVAAGQQFDAEVTVENTGLEVVADAKVAVRNESGAVLAEVALEPLSPDCRATVALPVTLPAVGLNGLTAVILADDDPAGNEAVASVEVVAPVMPTVNALVADVVDGAVELSWEPAGYHGAVTDNVESYTDWAIDAVGQWSMFDGDYAPTVYINKDLGEYPNATARKAFQVCNAKTLGIDIWDEGKPRSGNKMFMAPASIGVVNNDWLISPRLNGDEQWISFFARSFTTDGIAPERMKVWYSTAGADIADFVCLTDNTLELPGTWQEYRFMVPEGARYFAINCVSDDSFALFIDDLTFNDMTVPRLHHIGYEVTLNGETVAEVTEPAYTHQGGGGEFAVRPLYTEGPGRFCTPVKVEIAGVGQLKTDVTVIAVEGGIAIAGYTGEVTVTDTLGRTFRSTANHLSLAPGIYLVTIADTTSRVVVR